MPSSSHMGKKEFNDSSKKKYIVKVEAEEEEKRNKDYNTKDLLSGRKKNHQ